MRALDRWRCRHGFHDYEWAGYTPETDVMLNRAFREESAAREAGQPTCDYRLGISVDRCSRCGHEVTQDRRIYLT